MRKASAPGYQKLADELRRISEDVRGESNRLSLVVAAQVFERLAEIEGQRVAGAL